MNKLFNRVRSADWLTVALIVLSLIFSKVFYPEHFWNFGLSIGILSLGLKSYWPAITGIAFIGSGVLQNLFAFLPTTRPATPSLYNKDVQDTKTVER